MKLQKKLIAALVVQLFSVSGYATPIVHISDFISDSTRSNFNSFELIPNDGTFYTGGSGPYVEDGIKVQQIDGDPGNDIWVTFNPNSIAYLPGGLDGSFGWYPNGGDRGYTSIQLADGSEFGDVGLIFGSGFWASHTVSYELWRGASLVLSGSLTAPSTFSYLGFQGGGFDTVLIRDTDQALAHPVGDGTVNGLVIDAIEVRVNQVPAPGTLALFALGLMGLISWTRKANA